ASPIRSAREVNGQEQPVGPAEVKNGSLVASFTAYQPRTFAIHLDTPAAHVAAVHSQPVNLHYDLAGASSDGSPVPGGFDGQGTALPAEMLPETLRFQGVDCHLASAQNGTPDALVANGQSIQRPAGEHNRAYILAAAIGGDQKAEFRAGDRTTTLNIEDWGGFIG